MRERDIFIEALQRLDPIERSSYLTAACAADDALLGRVLQLLAEHEKQESFLLDSPLPFGAGAATLDEPITERPGTVIGPYKLLEQIGEGGFGLVFVAEQQQPIRRKVALKVIKPGMDTLAVIARFEAERQALALMDHPNIARVLDAGTTASGRPFFVMELVKGVPITDYCDQNQLTPRERLELFLSVCQAVQHAHQKGIIHRDLKPSNVMVMSHDGRPVVRVIDFGVAKAIGQQLTDKTIYTQFTQLIGTPLYMSPEQAGQSSLDVDTRSDIYSLGVLLYELLTGTTPFDKERLQQAGYDEIRRIIREEEPPKPSTRISTLSKSGLPSRTTPVRQAGPTARANTSDIATIATQRKIDPKRLSQLFRGELDWIVMKALEKDRNRRYETASAFAGDVQRYLQDEPVQACPPSAGYRLRKFVRRHKGPATAAVALALSLIIGVTAVVLVQAKANRELAAVNRRLEQANERERQRFALAMEAVGMFHGEVSKDLLLKEKQFAALRDKLLRAAPDFYQKLERLLKDEDDAESQATLAKAYFDLGRLTRQIGTAPAAMDAYQKALAVRRELATRPNAGPQAALDVAWTLLEVGRLEKEDDKALVLFEEARAMAERVERTFEASDSSRRVRASAARLIGLRLYHMDRLPDAYDALEQARAILQSLTDAHPTDTGILRELVEAHRYLGFNHVENGNLSEARKHYRKTHAVLLAAATADPTDLECQAELATSYISQAWADSTEGRVDTLKHYETARAICQRLVDAYPSVTRFEGQLADHYSYVAAALSKTGRRTEARAAFEQARAINQRLLAANAPSAIWPDFRVAIALNDKSLAGVDRLAGRVDEARAGYNRAIAALEEWLKAHPKYLVGRMALADSFSSLGLLECRAGRFAEAATATRRAMELYASQPPRHFGILFARACCHAVLAELAGKEGTAVPANAASDEAAKAMDLLQRSVAGYYPLHALRTEPALDSLRQREDFKKLVLDVEAKIKANELAGTEKTVK